MEPVVPRIDKILTGLRETTSFIAEFSRDLRPNMNIKPLQGRIIVKPKKEDERSSGLSIPDSKKEKPIEGKVIAVGNGKTLEDGRVEKMDIQTGDAVLYEKYSGTEIKIEGVEHVILHQDEVLAVIDI